MLVRRSFCCDGRAHMQALATHRPQKLLEVAAQRNEPAARKERQVTRIGTAEQQQEAALTAERRRSGYQAPSDLPPPLARLS